MCYNNNMGMVCGLCQIHHGIHPLSKSKVWNEELSVRYLSGTIRGHVMESNNVKHSIHLISVEKEFANQNSLLIKESKEMQK